MKLSDIDVDIIVKIVEENVPGNIEVPPYLFEIVNDECGTDLTDTDNFQIMEIAYNCHAEVFECDNCGWIFHHDCLGYHPVLDNWCETCVEELEDEE